MKSKAGKLFINIISSGKSFDRETGSFGISDNMIRYIILNCICIFGVGTLVFFTVRNIYLNLMFEAAASLIMAVIGAACFFAARSKIPQAVPFWFAMISFGLLCCILVWSGGIAGSSFLFIYIYPPLVIILLGMTGGVIASSLLFLIVAVEYMVPGASRFIHYDTGIFPQIITPYLLEMMIIVVFEWSRQNKDRINKKLTDELKHINENLQEIVEERTDSLMKLRDCFGRYLPDNIIKKVMESPDGPSLGGEKRLVTILITDIRGFTLLTENTDSEIIVKMLNHYFTVMVEKIHSFDGTIIEFIGDSILAIFGAPLENKKHADHAVACALEMQTEMSKVNAWNGENGCPVIEMGIGINSGETIVGNIGSDKAMKYNVIGKHVNLASRIETYSTGGQVLISPFTKQCLSAELTVADTLEIAPKGFSGTILVSRVTALGEPFNAAYHAEFPRLIKLEKPVPLQCYRINEKDVDRNVIETELREVSEKEAVIVPTLPDNTDNIFEVFDNVKLRCGTIEVTAKVNTVESGRIILRFTSDSKSFVEKASERRL